MIVVTARENTLSLSLVALQKRQSHVGLIQTPDGLTCHGVAVGDLMFDTIRALLLESCQSGINMEMRTLNLYYCETIEFCKILVLVYTYNCWMSSRRR